MEVRLLKNLSNMLILLFNYLAGDVEKFISRVRFFLGFFPTIFCADDEQVLQKMPCKKSQNLDARAQEGEIGIAEMSMMVMKRLGMVWGVLEEGTNDNSSVGEQDVDVVSLFEEEEPSFDEIKETFRMFDANNDGFVDASDLRRILSNLGLKERHGLEDCKKMINAFDSNGDGLIDFQDFVKFMEKCLC